MSTAKLKATRDEIEAKGIGIFLPVMQELFSAIDEHVADDSITVEAPSSADTTTQLAHAEQLKAQVADLTKQVADLDEKINIRKIEIIDYTKAAEAAKATIPVAEPSTEHEAETVTEHVTEPATEAAKTE